MTIMVRFVDHDVRIQAVGTLLLALLLAVMSSPIRPSITSPTAPSPNYLLRNFAVLNDAHSGQTSASARDSLRDAVFLTSYLQDELDASTEEELTATSPPTEASFGISPSSYVKPHFEWTVVASARIALRLRC